MNLLATLCSFFSITEMSKSIISSTYEYLAEDLKQVKVLIDNYCQCNLPEASDVLNLIRERNGKMIRPMLVLLSGKAFGQLKKDHYLIAAIIEMVHVASLLHDDVLDEAETRRYQPSLNNLVGNKAAVLAGDLLLSIALTATLDLESKDEFGEVIKIVGQVCEGELAQQRTSGDLALTEEQYFNIVSHKTASLLACCIERGAFVSGASQEDCKLAFGMGLEFGIAFQVMDDIRDILSLEGDSGKTVGTDFLLGKLTLPLIHHISTSGDGGLEWLKSVSSSNFNEEVKRELVGRLNQTDSLEYCRVKVLSFSKGIRDFVVTIKEEKLREAYEALIDTVVKV